MLRAKCATKGSIVCAEEEGKEADLGGRWVRNYGGQDLQDLF